MRSDFITITIARLNCNVQLTAVPTFKTNNNAYAYVALMKDRGVNIITFISLSFSHSPGPPS